MSNFKYGIIVMVVISLTAVGWAEREPADSILRLTLDLADGSRIMGVPRIKSVPVQTSYAKMDIPLSQILSATIDDDHETGSFDLRNGDKLRGVIDLGPIKLETIFGKVSIDIEHIKRIDVVSTDVQGGPVLYYSFDDDRDEQVIDKSGYNLHGRLSGGTPHVQGVSGKGIQTSSKNTYAICDTPGLRFDEMRQLTVSAWVKMSRYATYGNVVGHGNNGVAGAFGISVGGTYGGKPYDGSFSVRLGDGKGVSVRPPRFIELNKWCHIAGVYDGRTVTFYANGDLVGTEDVPREQWHSPLSPQPGADLIIGRSCGRPTWLDTHINGVIDEIMIFDRALSANEVQRLYTSIAQ
jgi:hypothetical protein